MQLKLVELDKNTWNYLTVCKQMINIKKELLSLDCNSLKYFTVCKQISSCLYKNVTYNLFIYKCNI